MATLNFTKTAGKEQWEATYTGDSGVLQVKRKGNGKMYIYGNAGVGYMLLDEVDSKDFLRYLNMEGLNAIKFVSMVEVEQAVVNNG